MLIIPENIILQTMQTVIDRWLLPKFNELGMNATGEWKENVKPIAEPNKGIISGRKYTEQLVYGRRPNKNGTATPEENRKWAYGMAMSNPEFKAWLQVRGLTQYGVQIAYKIADQGTDLLKKGGSDLLEVLEQPEVIDFVNSQIGEYLQAQVQIQIVRDLKEVFA